MTNQQFQEAINSVHDAERAVLDAQGNTDPEHYQQAQQHLFRAQKLLNELEHNHHSGNEEETRQLQHARELLKHLLEAQNSI
ncbi:hypothetical protein [Salinibacillus xinjiangensis]|uniref:DUF2524 family protein n=1 Tax=Salinibacillus xinjiangensis TaxID=1229268 RepID=A0A6G1X5W9_9BACI|nr:hypothetical protein [Salinibacillus xinjiangensis]MRG86364.1 hypothetical protein [Salinibacillus xinjiangensis]